MSGMQEEYEMLEGQAEPGVWQEVKGRKVNSDLQRLMDSTAEFDSTDEEEAGPEGGSEGSRGDFYQLEFRQHKRWVERCAPSIALHCTAGTITATSSTTSP